MFNCYNNVGLWYRTLSVSFNNIPLEHNPVFSKAKFPNPGLRKYNKINTDNTVKNTFLIFFIIDDLCYRKESVCFIFYYQATEKQILLPLSLQY